ncbi:MAG TPA: sulfotransferase domain-containing protein [Euzebyales bacterium]|nr:sulfotransferase domain-containing protein [Euzebyales bacterium]
MAPPPGNSAVSPRATVSGPNDAQPVLRPNIVILGLAKTGSTGLYNNAKAALSHTDPDYYFLFEPTRPDQLHNIRRYAPRLPLLTKVMIAREPDLQLPYEHFAKRVTLVRDPRDMIVSFLLFRPFIRADVPWEKVEPFVEAIRAKERDPASRSVQSLHALADELGLASYRLERVVEYMERQEALIDRHQVYTLRYEDFILGQLDGLNEYLGITVENQTTTSPWLDHILRAAGTGDWRHWLTAEDIGFYRPHVAPYMKRFDYDDNWQLAAEPVIDPSTASQYIAGKYRKRFAQQEERRRKLALDIDTPEQRARVEQLAEDGNAQAMYRLAKALLDSQPEAAFRLVHRAAVQGHRSAMRQLAQLYRGGRGVPADTEQADFWARESGDDGTAEPVPSAQGPRPVRRVLDAARRTLRGR